MKNEPLMETALLAIEVWNFLTEKEREYTSKAKAAGDQFVGFIQQYQWSQLVQMFLGGIDQTGYEIDDDQFGDDIDNSVSTRCAIAL